jgi:hypothetical protein
MKSIGASLDAAEIHSRPEKSIRTNLYARLRGIVAKTTWVIWAFLNANPSCRLFPRSIRRGVPLAKSHAIFGIEIGPLGIAAFCDTHFQCSINIVS